MDREEWRSLIDYWVGDGHDIKYLDIPQDVADELGIELPPREETDMADNTELTAETREEIVRTGVWPSGRAIDPLTHPELAKLAADYAAANPANPVAAAAQLRADEIRAFNESATKLAQGEHEANAAAAEATVTTVTPLFKFKKKKSFDGTVCGLQGCSKKLPVEGAYVSGVKSTKGDNSRLWYGPACAKCVEKTHSGMTPDTLAQLAQQRNGASDLALILDVEVGDIQKRLAAAGIDEQGQTNQTRTPGTTVGGINLPKYIYCYTQEEIDQLPDMSSFAPGFYFSDEADILRGPYGFQAQAEADLAAYVAHLNQPKGVQTKTPEIAALDGMQPTAIPTEHLATISKGIQDTLVFLGTFNIHNQPEMDAAGGWLATVKSQWKDTDEMRKALGKPYRDKTTEIQTHFNPVLAQLAQAEGLIKQKISEGQERANAAQQAALQQAQKAHAAGNMQAAGQAAQQVAATDVALPQGVTQRPNLVKYEVMDPMQVPGEYWSVDPAKLQAALAAGVRQINGVRIWEEPSLQARQS